MKRAFDIVLSILLMPWLFMMVVPLFFISLLTFGKNGIFIQDRVGKEGRLFKIFKIRTLNDKGKTTKFFHLVRKSKLDELPQVFNILIGDMSFVGPRPDVVGFADALRGEERAILTVKPGLTGPASLYFLDEDSLLERANKPEDYNRTVIWPKKVALNLAYVKNYSLGKDLYYLMKTVSFSKIYD